MENLIEISGVPVITAIVFFVMQGFKLVFEGKERAIKFIPLIAGITGGILGVVAFYGVQDIMPAGNVLTALLIGLVSGLAATGSNQIYKQLFKNNNGASENTDGFDD